MDLTNPISATVFSAYLKCPTKAYLLDTGERAPGTYFADIEAEISTIYKATVKSGSSIEADLAEPLHWDQLASRHDYKAILHRLDCDTVLYDPQLPPQGPAADHRPLRSLPSDSLVSVLRSPWQRLGPFDSLLVCFGALALWQATGNLPDKGEVIYGDAPRRTIVKIGNHLTRTRKTIESIAAIRHSRVPPPLVLNRHCAICDFQPRCRGLAIERDDLSLLSAMTAKERTKYAAKGITTITQLSYGYRPRRRKRTRPDAERSAKSSRPAVPATKHDHKIRALAIKKKQTHVVKPNR